MGYLADALTCCGMLLLVAGIALIYVPAAVIAAGLLLLVAARQLERPT